MNKYEFDYLVFIGRFQPIHNEHLRIIREALRLSNKLIIIIGSCVKARNIRDPFTFKERVEMIENSLSGEESRRVTFCASEDYMYNDSQWAVDIQTMVWTLTGGVGKIGIIGFHKDATSYYLDMFPQWTFIDAKCPHPLNADYVRHVLFDNAYDPLNEREVCLQDKVPKPVLNWLGEFMIRPEYKHLREEHKFIRDYKAAWEKAPYQPTFVTTDAIVEQAGHLILIKRKAMPGKGLWALPGGFLNPNQKTVDSMIRELREETRIKVPAPVLKGSIVGSNVFDHPMRSLRGRTITHATHIHLPDGPLPEIKGGDDAEKAHWFNFNEVSQMRDQLFEDHGHIIHYFTGIMKR